VVLEVFRHDSVIPSVATAIADVFQNNGISVGRNLAKILKIFEKIWCETLSHRYFRTVAKSVEQKKKRWRGLGL
jgi:hypothetical protein